MWTPDSFGLPYEEVTLETVDRVKIQCYLILQHKKVAEEDSSSVRSLPDETDEQVRMHLAAWLAIAMAQMLMIVFISDWCTQLLEPRTSADGDHVPRKRGKHGSSNPYRTSIP